MNNSLLRKIALTSILLISSPLIQAKELESDSIDLGTITYEGNLILGVITLYGRRTDGHESKYIAFLMVHKYFDREHYVTLSEAQKLLAFIRSREQRFRISKEGPEISHLYTFSLERGTTEVGLKNEGLNYRMSNLYKRIFHSIAVGGIPISLDAQNKVRFRQMLERGIRWLINRSKSERSERGSV